MPFTPTTPTISVVTFNSALITKGADGNGPSTYYSFQLTYNVNLSTQIMYLKSDGTFSDIPVWLNVTALTATALIPNTLYSVRLNAATDAIGTNATGEGPAGTFTTAAAQPLFQPFSAIYSTQATANWNPNFNDDETVYQVQLSTDPSFVFVSFDTGFTVTDNSYIFTNLLPNTIYYGQVRAENDPPHIPTAWTSLGSVTTPAGPSQVQGIRSTNLLANRGFLIQWSANVEPNISVYRVYRSSSPTDNSSFQVIGTTPANVTSYADNVPYTFGITWYYKITALDNGNNESSLELTNPVQDMSFSQFVEQPFPTTVQTDNIVNQEIPSGLINGISTTITNVSDGIHLVVNSTTGFVAGAADDTTAGVPFSIVSVDGPSALTVSSTAGMSNGDTIVQGNTLYTTTYPYKKGTLNIYLNGVQLILGIDYNLLIPQQFTLLAAPESGDYLRVAYLRF